MSDKHMSSYMCFNEAMLAIPSFHTHRLLILHKFQLLWIHISRYLLSTWISNFESNSPVKPWARSPPHS